MIPNIPSEFVEQVLNLACQIQQIPSPTYQEAEKARFVARKFSLSGLQDIQTDAVGNVLARIPGGGKARPLVISAHMDTVFPLDISLELQRGASRITGPGIGDNSLGLAALLSIPEMLKLVHYKPRGDVWLGGTVCEEGLGNLRGIQAITERFGHEPRAYISLEGIGLGEILHRGLGVERYRISVDTGGGHSWLDYGRPSAIHVLARIAAQLAEIKLPHHPRTILNIGTISGGTAINTIAAHAQMDLDLRSESAQRLADLCHKVEQIVKDARDMDINVSLERIGWRPAGELPLGHPLIALTGDILMELGLAPHLDIASTDANIPLSKGYPAITIGLTSGDRAHTVQEYINPYMLETGLQQILGIILRIWEI